MEFDYYYGSQADQYTFIRIPKLILIDTAFAGLSIQAKILYAVLLDRMGLSMKNGWMDKDQRIYIIYQIQEIQEDLGFSKKKAIDYLGELEKIGLVEKKRRGFGLPSILYVKSFMSGISVQMGTSRSVEMGTSGEWQNNDCLENLEENADENIGFHLQETDNSVKTSGFEVRSSQIDTTRSVETGTSRSSQIALQEVSKMAPQEVPKSAPLNSSNNINHTEQSNIQSNQILSSASSEEMRWEAMSMADTKRMIMDRIEYDCLIVSNPFEKDMLNSIVDIMLEVAMNQSSVMIIASASYPTELVQDRFNKLGSEHVQYVIDCFNANTTRVGNPFEEEVAIICNEEGKINGLPLNRALYDDRGKIYDVVAGTFLVTGLTEDSFGSLTPEQVNTYTQMYQTPETFMRMGRDIVAIPIELKGEKVNPLAKVEEMLEDDYGMIDGIINNGPRKDDEAKSFDKTENKRSIHDRLEEGKETVKAYDRARGEETKTVSKGEREI